MRIREGILGGEDVRRSATSGSKFLHRLCDQEIMGLNTHKGRTVAARDTCALRLKFRNTGRALVIQANT